MELGGRGGDDGFGGVGGIAGPVGDGAAGAADDGDEGGDVPRVHDGIEGDVDETGGEEQVAVAIRPRAVESGAVDEAIAGGGILVTAEIAVIAGDERGGGEIGGGTGADGLAVEGGGRVVADHELAERGLVDRAEDGLTVVEEADEGRPKGNAGDETLGAVDGVEHPGPFGVGVHVAVLFTNDAVLGEAGRDEVTHEFLRALVGGGDGGVVGFEFDGGAGVAKKRGNEVGAGLSEFGDESAIGGGNHGSELGEGRLGRHGKI